MEITPIRSAPFLQIEKEQYKSHENAKKPNSDQSEDLYDLDVVVKDASFHPKQKTDSTVSSCGSTCGCSTTCDWVCT